MAAVTSWGIEPNRVGHGPFEKNGLICRDILGARTEYTVIPAARRYASGEAS